MRFTVLGEKTYFVSKILLRRIKMSIEGAIFSGGKTAVSLVIVSFQGRWQA